MNDPADIPTEGGNCWGAILVRLRRQTEGGRGISDGEKTSWGEERREGKNTIKSVARNSSGEQSRFCTRKRVWKNEKPLSP